MWELGDRSDRPEWREVETPFDQDLYHVAQTVEGPYAIGSSGSLAANRGDGWEVVMDEGPATRDNELNSMTATTDGRRLWFAGSSGALGCYDVVARRKFDYSFPKEMTSTWEGMTVAGKRGSEKGLIANGSGEILPFEIDGFDVNWGVTHKPDKRGSKVAAVSSSPDGVGYAVDTSGNVFKTTKDEGWKDIGIVNAQVKFYDIHANKQGEVYVSAGDGRVYRYDDSYHAWTPIRVTENAAIKGIDTFKDQIVALGTAGALYQRTDKYRWEKVHTPTSDTLYDIALGYPDIAVGDSGTIIKRPRKEKNEWGAGKSADGDNFEGRGELYDGDQYGRGEEKQSGDSSGDSTSGDSTSGDSTSGDSTSGDSTSGDSTSGDSTSGDSTSGDSTSDGSTSDGSTSGDSTQDGGWH